MVSNATPAIPNTYNYPMNGAPSAVTINILNPATYPNATVYPPAQALAQPLPPETPTQPAQLPTQQYPYNYNNQFNPTIHNTNAAPAADGKKEAEKPQKTVPLTDEYIKNLESALNDKNPKIRLTAANEILNRFKEDENRKQDPALTALLNKALQDPAHSVRFLALTILDVGYAQGNENTVQILHQLEQDNADEYGENRLLASQVLVKLGSRNPQNTQIPTT